jgi:hypothetical protein
MIIGYKNKKAIWKIYRFQRNPGRFVEKNLESNLEQIHYVDMAKYKGMTLLKALRDIAYKNDIVLKRN